MRMRLSCTALLAVAASAAQEYACPSMPPAGVVKADRRYKERPMVDCTFKFIGGKKEPYAGKVADVTSPIFDAETGERLVIGKLPAMDENDALEAVKSAAAAWDRGQGEWPRMSIAARIAAIERLVEELKKQRSAIVESLIWEIAKTSSDAAKEFDRTMDFIAAAIEELRRDPSVGTPFSSWSTVSGVGVRVRRGPVGVMLGLAPFNYPLNEMYAMLIPALLMGNTAVLKLPAIGSICHCLTASAFAAVLPAGVINFVSGSGRATMAPIMQSGLVDVLGFIGGTKGADALIKQHPTPHRLKVFAQLEGKNLGIVLPDADLDTAVGQCVLGSLSYNGQRCTAIKLIMVHESIKAQFVEKLVEKVASLGMGLPWEENVSITPLPEGNKPKHAATARATKPPQAQAWYLEELIADALSKGASLANRERGGGELAGALFKPAVLEGVTPEMRIFHEEQFGPVVPVASFSDVGEVLDAIKTSWNGQQAAIFTSSAEAAAPLVDSLSTVVGRINLNAQCGRSPDVVPFSGRRSSAMGTMSVADALRAFSIDTVLAYTAKDESSRAVASGLDTTSTFLAPL